MAASESRPRPDIRYDPRRCKFLGKVVWAIVMQRPDGSWRVVNCLDKDDACFGVGCAFTTDQGEWPYTGTAVGAVVGDPDAPEH